MTSALVRLPSTVMNNSTASRREFLQELLWLGTAAAALRSADCAPAAALSHGQLPRIKLGSLEVSRLILGSNPFFGFAHGNPQASAREMTEYYTDERVMAVLDAAADHGITAVWTPCYDHWMRLWNQYQERGGKLKTWIAQPDQMPMEKDLEAAFKNGAKAVCIQGMRIDDQVQAGRWEVVRGWLEWIKSRGLPAGMATHGARTHLIAEEKGLPADFYHQTMYRPDNYVRAGLEESLATIAQLKKPVIAYKVLGAGRIPPETALPALFKKLKPKDGVCVGVFPKKRDEIAENAALTRQFSNVTAS